VKGASEVSETSRPPSCTRDPAEDLAVPRAAIIVPSKLPRTWPVPLLAVVVEDLFGTRTEQAFGVAAAVAEAVVVTSMRR
jgi:hypothetical protein